MSIWLKITEDILKLLASANGRDKATRVYQYFFRFIEALILRQATRNGNGKLQETAQRFKKMAASLSLTRKVMRFGKEFNIAENLNKNIKHLLENPRKISYEKEDNLFYIWLSIIKCIMGFNYMTADHYIYFIKIGVIKKNPSLYAKLDKYLNSSWLTESIINILQYVIEIVLLRKKLEVQLKGNTYTDKEVAELNANYQKKLNAICLEIIKAALDATMAFGFLKKTAISMIILDFIGVITSLIGAYQVWPRK